MSRAQLRELTALFVIGSALTVAVFFLALCRTSHLPLFLSRDSLDV
jgi:hypothetical protein